MAVLVTTDIYGKTQLGYDELLSKIKPSFKETPGLILHSSHRIRDGWRIIEVWKSKAEASEFFRGTVVPNLPSSRKPMRSFQDLHSCVKGRR